MTLAGHATESQASMADQRNLHRRYIRAREEAANAGQLQPTQQAPSQLTAIRTGRASPYAGFSWSVGRYVSRCPAASLDTAKTLESRGSHGVVVRW